MNKRGQFYLAAAIIIALVIFAFAAVNNYSTPKERQSAVFDLGTMLGTESGKVVDYSLYNSADTSSMIENFSHLVVDNSQSGDIERWIIVYGTPDEITILNFINGTSGDVKVDYGTGNFVVTMANVRMNKTQIVGSNLNSVNVTLEGNTYHFDMQSGQNFAFLIKDATYVAQTDVANTGNTINEANQNGQEGS